MNLFFRSGLLLLALGLIPACGTNDPTQNTMAPSFGGLTAANPGPAAGEVTLSWAPAIELNGGTLVYDVFQTNAGSGTENLGAPSYQTTSGTGFTISGLNSANHYWFIVQAQDAGGNVDGNTMEVEVIAP
jgi:hypothetical protein